MFVANNSLEALKDYFSRELDSIYSLSEIKLIVKSLVVKRLNINNSEYLSLSVDVFSESDLLYFRNAVKALQDNVPFQYVIGDTEFYNIELKCDKRALIPRPETEELVDWIIQSEKSEQNTIVDLCSGSGCIALSIKKANPNWNVIAIEYSKDAISLIQENSHDLNLPIEVIEQDVLQDDAYAFLTDSHDIWVSNPPYIPENDKAFMHDNVLEHEPHMALFVENDDPTVFYREIAKAGNKYLKKGGRLYFEIHENLAKEVVQDLKEQGYSDIEIRKDLQGKDRMIKAIKN